MAEKQDGYTVTIRRVSDGAERNYKHEGSSWESSDEWNWTDGNFGCDCNLRRFFARAGGDPEPQSRSPCGYTAFDVVRVTQPDGSVVFGEPKSKGP